MAEHTKGPLWVAYDDEHGRAVISGEHIEVATCWHHNVGSIEKEMRANAARIVACVNALEGYNPDAVRDVVEAAKLLADSVQGTLDRQSEDTIEHHRKLIFALYHLEGGAS